MFSLDGLGLLSYESLVRRDYPVVLGTLYFFTLIGLVVKLVGDLMYVVADPRVQFAARGEMSAAPDGRRLPTAGRSAGRAPATASLSPNAPRLGAVQAQPSRPRLAVDLRRACCVVRMFAELVSQRSAARRALPGRVVVSGHQQSAGDALRRRFRRRPPIGTTRSSREQFAKDGNFALFTMNRVRRQLDSIISQNARRSGAAGGTLAGHRACGPRHHRAPVVRLSRQHPVRSGADRSSAPCSAS